MSIRQFRWCTLVLCIFTSFTTAYAQNSQLTVVSWNVESGDSEIQTITQKMRSFQGVDIWGMSEVPDDAAASAFESAAENGGSVDFSRVVGTTGGADRLVVIFNSQRFDKVRHEELHNINIGGSVRSPLFVQLKEKSSGAELIFMVNHLYRGSIQGRHQQAKLLNLWAQNQTVPVIAVGDYNFDWSVQNGDFDHDAGYDHLTQGGVFTWVRPATLIKSQCSPDYNSVLDFIFVTRSASTWNGASEIVVTPNDCPDDNKKSDHRPVKASFALGGSLPPPLVTTKAQILQQIREIEDELKRLKELVNQLN